jgi:flavin-dependent thymidylate synthase
MNVTLIDFTGNGCPNPARHAANVLLFTKSTRLDFTPELMLQIAKMEEEEVMFNLRVMSGTNPGSWEFIHFTFFIQDVTRSFTHQLVRTRTASYAQQSLRVVSMKDFSYGTGPSIENNRLVKGAYDNTMDNAAQCYNFLIDAEVNMEDARGVLPMNIHTNICMSINMRNWINMVRKRSSLRVQDEYRNVLDLMITEVEKVYPWIYIFIKNDELKARKDLQNMIYDNKNLTSEEKTAMIKKLDIITTSEV